MTEKRCRKCGQEKALGQFSKNMEAPDSLSYSCRACRHEHYAANKERILASKRARYAANPRRYAAGDRAWRLANPERNAAIKRAWRAANPEHCAAVAKAWAAANPGRKSELGRAWRAANPERSAKNSRSWRLAHLTRHSASVHAWRVANADRRVAIEQKRRAAKRSVENTLTSGEWKILQDEFGHRCAYCGEKPLKRLTQDHVQPLTFNGPHSYENVVPACRSCNARKGIKRVEQFLAALQ